VDAAKRLLADGGYAGEPAALTAPQEVPVLRTWGDVTVDLLKRLDMKVDLAAVYAGILFARSVQKSPPGRCMLMPLMGSMSRPEQPSVRAAA
jgi:peptide/nickel transport system substrate-binding protein